MSRHCAARVWITVLKWSARCASLDRPYGLLHAAVALPEQLSGFIEQAGGGGGAVGDLVDRLGHLGDGGGDLIGLCLLLLQVAGDGLGIAQIAFGTERRIRLQVCWVRASTALNSA